MSSCLVMAHIPSSTTRDRKREIIFLSFLNPPRVMRTDVRNALLDTSLGRSDLLKHLAETIRTVLIDKKTLLNPSGS